MKKIILVIKSFLKLCVDSWNTFSSREAQAEINEEFFKARRDNIKTSSEFPSIISQRTKPFRDNHKIVCISKKGEPAQFEIKKDYFHVVTPNLKTRKYKLDKSRNLTFMFRTQKEADKFSKNHVEPYFGTYSDFTIKFKEFMKGDLGEPWRKTGEINRFFNLEEELEQAGIKLVSVKDLKDGGREYHTVFLDEVDEPVDLKTEFNNPVWEEFKNKKMGIPWISPLVTEAENRVKKYLTENSPFNVKPHCPLCKVSFSKTGDGGMLWEIPAGKKIDCYPDINIKPKVNCELFTETLKRNLVIDKIMEDLNSNILCKFCYSLSDTFAIKCTECGNRL